MRINQIILNCFYKLESGDICFVSRFEDKDIYVKTLNEKEKCVSAKDLYPIEIDTDMSVVLKSERFINFGIINVIQDGKPIHHYIRYYLQDWGMNTVSVKYVHEFQQIMQIATGTDNMFLDFEIYFTKKQQNLNDDRL